MGWSGTTGRPSHAKALSAAIPVIASWGFARVVVMGEGCVKVGGSESSGLMVELGLVDMYITVGMTGTGAYNGIQTRSNMR
jgi:hypothetical protein